MDEVSNNYKNEYSKNGNNCFHKSEKLTNLYYDEQSHAFKQYEINDAIYKCNICPRGIYFIKNNTFQINAKNVLNNNIQIM